MQMSNNLMLFTQILWKIQFKGEHLNLLKNNNINKI